MAVKEYHYRCTRCGEHTTISLQEEGVEAWRNGELIQVAMPTVPATQREMIKMNWCETCVDEVYVMLENLE